MNTAAILEFFRELELNNNKAWYDAHKAEYRRLRREFVAFLEGLAERIAFFDPVVQLHLGEPKLVRVFRINRDLRFSPDRRPYKTNLGGTIGASDGEGHPMYYVSIQPGNSMVGGGIYMPSSRVLQAIREKVAVDYADLEKIVNDKAFVTAFPDGLTRHGALKTAPRGYSVDHPAIEFLRLKSFAATHTFGDDEVTQVGFPDRALDCCEAMSKLNAYLDSARR